MYTKYIKTICYSFLFKKHFKPFSSIHSRFQRYICGLISSKIHNYYYMLKLLIFIKDIE